MFEHAALYERRQNGYFVVKRLAERASVIEVYGKRMVAEHRKPFEMVAIHVAGQKVKNSRIDEIQ